MHLVDVPRPGRVDREPDATEVLLGSGALRERGLVVSRVELRLYEEGADEDLGPYSLITSFVDTDRGSVEMVYDEGFRGPDALGRAARFVASSLGLSALVLRSVIALEGGAGLGATPPAGNPASPVGPDGPPRRGPQGGAAGRGGRLFGGLEVGDRAVDRHHQHPPAGTLPGAWPGDQVIGVVRDELRPL